MRTDSAPRGLRRVVIASLLTALTLTGCSGAEGGESEATSLASPTSADSGGAGKSTGSDTTEPASSEDAGAATTSSQDGDGGDAASGQGEREAPATVTTAAEPTALGEFEYEAVPEPAPQELQTLCDLTQEYFGGRREVSLDDGRVGEGMQLTVVALSDQMGIWIGLQEQYPGAAEDIRRAEVILQHWDNALAASQQGLVSEEEAYLSEADSLIGQLPTQAAVEGVVCGE